MTHLARFVAIALAATTLFTPTMAAQEKPANVFARSNLVAWCIVPFDGKNRGPAERTEMGAFAKTIKESRASIRVLYDHGHDPQIGNKPLGPIKELREENYGPFYEVPLIDTDYNRNFIIPALDAELLGASYRFRVIREEWNEEPGESAHNPKGLPERTIKEAQLFEFGPVTFPAFEGASAKLRSISDRYHDLSTSTSRTDAAPSGTSASDAATIITPDAGPSDVHLGGPTPRERRMRALQLRGITS